MSELVAFVRARLDDDEATASLIPDPVVAHEGDCCGSLCEACGHCLHSAGECSCSEGGCGCWDATAELPALNRRVLAQVAAMRRILDLHEGGHECESDRTRQPWFDAGEEWAGPCDTLRALASIWRDRPGWRKEWDQ